MRDLLRQPGPAGQFAQRGRIIERRFAQLKQHDGFRRWTVWGLEDVRIQWALLCATLNLRVLYRGWRQGPADAGQRAAVAVVVVAQPMVATVRGRWTHWAQVLGAPIARPRLSATSEAFLGGWMLCSALFSAR